MDTPVHRPDDSRFEISTPSGTALAAYRREGRTLVLTHTEVPASLRRQGIAGRLASAIAEHARREGLALRPVCSYMAWFFRTHGEYHDLLAARS